MDSGNNQSAPTGHMTQQQLKELNDLKALVAIEELGLLNNRVEELELRLNDTPPPVPVAQDPPPAPLPLHWPMSQQTHRYHTGTPQSRIGG